MSFIALEVFSLPRGWLCLCYGLFFRLAKARSFGELSCDDLSWDCLFSSSGPDPSMKSISTSFSKFLRWCLRVSSLTSFLSLIFFSMSFFLFYHFSSIMSFCIFYLKTGFYLNSCWSSSLNLFSSSIVGFISFASLSILAFSLLIILAPSSMSQLRRHSFWRLNTFYLLNACSWAIL